MSMRIFRVAAAALVVAACDSDAVGGPTGATTTAPPSLDAQVRAEIQRWGVVPLRAVAAQDPALVELGRLLFFDKILSGNRDASCATCHDPLTGTGDHRSLAIGTGAATVNGQRTPGPGRQFTPRNAVALFNSGLGQQTMFWDGRVQDANIPGEFRGSAGIPLPNGLTGALAAQAMLPVTNRVEMRGVPGDRDVFGNLNELAGIPDDDTDAIWGAAMQRVLSIPEYLQKFKVAYPTWPAALFGFQHAANAIAAFEVQAFAKSQSAFDRYLTRDDNALSVDAKRGALLFFGRAFCSSCHSGPLLGGQNFANVGVPQIGPGNGAAAPLDGGREGIPGNIRGVPAFMFRVPALRNVELTAPYMHNGAYPTLEAVVRHYSNVDSALKAYDVGQLEPALRATYHGDGTTVASILASLDGRLRQPLALSRDDQRHLVAFLRSLTDASARDMSSLIPASVPSGLPVR